MDQKDFQFVADLVKKRSGLVLAKEKVYLLESRLQPVARKHEMKDIGELVQAVRTKRDESLMHEVTDALTTNETFFFRDIKPFDRFRDIVLPQLLEARKTQRAIKIWCAAASTGQEPYSLAILLKEQAALLGGWRVSILGTDISTASLKRAREGVFSQFEVQRGLPVQLMLKYFRKKENLWEIDPAVKAMVQFRDFNLLDGFRALGQFDVVFCRNVLIYFEPAAKSDILARMRQQMSNDGVLFLGGAETILGISDKFKMFPNQRGIYSAC